MFEFIVNTFTWIKDLVGTIGSFVKSLLDGLKTIFTTLPLVANFATNAIGRLPSIIAVFAVLTISISIIYIIVGRETGG